MNSDIFPYYGAAVEAISSTTGVCPQAVGLAMTSLLAGIAGERAGIVGPLGELIRPSTNVIVCSSSAPWSKVQQLLLAPIEAVQRRVRDVSQSVSVKRVATMETARGVDSITDDILARNVFPTDGLGGANVEPSKFEALRRPTFVLVSPQPKSLSVGIEEVLDSAPLFVFPDGNIFAEKNPSDHLRAIADAVAGGDHLRAGGGFGRVQTVKGKLFATCAEAQIAAALASKSEPIQRILRHSLIVDIKEETVPILDTATVRNGYHRYREAVTEIYSSRRTGYGVTLEAASTAASMSAFINELAQMHAKFTEEYKPYFPNLLTLPYRVLWALLAVQQNTTYINELCEGAIHICCWTINQQIALLDKMLAQGAMNAREQQRQTMLGKLEKPCSMRELLRRYPNQRKALHEPILLELLNDGLVCRENNGLLHLAGRN